MSTPTTALDWDMTGPKGWTSGRNMNPVQVKSVSGFVSYWPDANHPDNAAIKLPVGAIIKAIRVRKVSHGTSSASYQLKITNDDNSYTYGTSVGARQRDEHDVILENVNRYIREAGVDQVIRIRTTSGNKGNASPQEMGPGDIFIVEYY